MKRALGRLARIGKDEGGNALAIGAAVMPLILGASAMAVDTIQLSVSKRQLQRAADSSAIAGARALVQFTEADEDDRIAAVEEAIHNDLDQNIFPVLSEEEDVFIGQVNGFNQAVRVTLNAERTMPFVSFFRSGPIEISVEAAATTVSGGEFCMVSLYDGDQPGITTNGTADVTLGCGMATNSRAESAVTAGGNSTITATPVAAVGGLDGESNNFVGDTTLQPYSAPQSDPFAHLPDPPAQTNCDADPNVAPNDDVTLSPGCYSGFTLKGDVTLEPGTYYITGDVDFTSQANVTGEGVTLVMTGPNGEAGDLKINGQANLDLSAPDGGDYAGVLFYRDRRSSNVEMRINGGADMSLQGALYFPSSDIFFAGNAGMEVECLQMVGRILTFRGTAGITNECPPGGASQAFSQNIVRLIV